MKTGGCGRRQGERAGFKPAPTVPSRKGDEKGGCGRRQGERAGFKPPLRHDLATVAVFIVKPHKGMKTGAVADGRGRGRVSNPPLRRHRVKGMTRVVVADGRGRGRVSNPPLRHDLATVAVYIVKPHKGMKRAVAADGKGRGRVSNPPLRHDLATVAVFIVMAAGG